MCLYSWFRQPVGGLLMLLAALPLQAAEVCTSFDDNPVFTLAEGKKMQPLVRSCVDPELGLRSELLWYWLDEHGKPAAVGLRHASEPYSGIDYRQFGRTLIADVYREYGGTLFVTDWTQLQQPEFWRLDYGGSNDSRLCIEQKAGQLHILHCAFGHHFGPALKLQRTPHGLRLINPAVLPYFTDWEKIPAIPSRILPR